jgi:hypothetical protein
MLPLTPSLASSPRMTSLSPPLPLQSHSDPLGIRCASCLSTPRQHQQPHKSCQLACFVFTHIPRFIIPEEIFGKKIGLFAHASHLSFQKEILKKRSLYPMYLPMEISENETVGLAHLSYSITPNDFQKINHGI